MWLARVALENKEQRGGGEKKRKRFGPKKVTGKTGVARSTKARGGSRFEVLLHELMQLVPGAWRESRALVREKNKAHVFKMGNGTRG